MPTTADAVNLAVARGVLQEIIPASATKPATIVFHVPTSSYQLHLRPTVDVTGLAGKVGKKIAGVITVQARRVDRTRAGGGRFVEPVFGRPRRVQGSVLAVDAGANTVTVNAGGGAAVDSLGLPIVLVLTDARQKPADFVVGELVGCDVLDGATFQPA